MYWRLLLLSTFLVILSSCQNEIIVSEKQIRKSDTIQIDREFIRDRITIEYESKDTSGWVDVIGLVPDAVADIRYATENNFVEEQLYECPACLLRPEAAEDMALVADSLRVLGYLLVLHDCYRPASVQQRLWNKVPDRRYVTPPAKGSKHNDGAAVDASLADLNGNLLDMGTDYDYFGREGWHDYTDLPKEILDRRTLLKNVMQANGFRAIRTEWWHYWHPRSAKYPQSDYIWSCH